MGLTARAFRHALTDEIFYDPNLNGFGANTNLDPTERRGVELDAQAALLSQPAPDGPPAARHRASGLSQYDGHEMVLVPKNVATLRLSWVPGNGHSADIGAQWVDRQRDGGDFGNTCSTRIPAYATMDALRTPAGQMGIRAGWPEPGRPPVLQQCLRLRRRHLPERRAPDQGIGAV
ncbi:TonB-dependent receptor [Massilia sp. H-1]|nr:TonB-dependent receptor [Massilia sp. H-1]